MKTENNIITGRIQNTGYNMRNQNVRPTHYLEKYYPIENRKDFFKWVIVTPNGLAKDYQGEVMYFDEFNLENAKTVLKAIKKVALKNQ